jgi:hypothetical protein
MWEELMTRLAAVALIVFNAVSWLFLLTVAGLFVFSLLCETIESIRDHRRKAGRLRAQVWPPRLISESWIGKIASWSE